MHDHKNVWKPFFVYKTTWTPFRYEDSEQHLYGEEIIKHPNWNTLSYDSDIALIKLSKPVILNNQVKLACLPKQGEQVKIGKNIPSILVCSLVTI